MFYQNSRALNSKANIGPSYNKHSLPPSITNIYLTLGHANNCTTLYIHYLKIGNPPPNTDEAWLAKTAWYTMIDDELYKRGYGQPLLKCVTREQAEYIIKEIYEGICGYHSGAQTMTTRILRAGYFWPTMEANCQEFVKKCIPCQKHDNLIHQK